MKKITAILIATVLVVVLVLSACSPKEDSAFESPESKSHIGDWTFELGEEEEDFFSKIDVTLRKDGTCSIVYLELEGSHEINQRYDGNYEIVKDLSHLPEDMLEDVLDDPEGDTDCSFFYDAENDELVTIVDQRHRIALTRAD